MVSTEGCRLFVGAGEESVGRTLGGELRMMSGAPPIHGPTRVGGDMSMDQSSPHVNGSNGTGGGRISGGVRSHVARIESKIEERRPAGLLGSKALSLSDTHALARGKEEKRDGGGVRGNTSPPGQLPLSRSQSWDGAGAAQVQGEVMC